MHSRPYDKWSVQSYGGKIEHAALCWLAWSSGDQERTTYVRSTHAIRPVCYCYLTGFVAERKLSPGEYVLDAKAKWPLIFGASGTFWVPLWCLFGVVYLLLPQETRHTYIATSQWSSEQEHQAKRKGSTLQHWLRSMLVCIIVVKKQSRFIKSNFERCCSFIIQTKKEQIFDWNIYFFSFLELLHQLHA